MEVVATSRQNMGEDAVFLGEARDIRHEYRKQANAGENPGA